MGRGIEGVGGGILGLRRLLADPETAGAIQADLLDRGLNLVDLGTWKLSYWDLLCVFRWLKSDSALMRLRHPDSWQWNLIEYLLAGIFDGIQGGNWQRAGNKNTPKPKPLPRPGIDGKKANTRVVKDTDVVSVPATDIRAELARRRAQYTQAAVPVADPVELPEPARPARRGRLRAAEVRAIRKMAQAGLNAEQLAAGFGINSSSVDKIITRETYRNVE
ncbi:MULTISPECIES: hypothetical protein [Rhodococcus]|uniref:hypothetical protein n=1 Tax=Rhodococcus TaxID=1827 RepID=UPI001E49841E|nr:MULTISPECIES: hypothetical protein [Rhodococcus]BDB58990.1 hypothetical protein RDE2_07840 [Rhodococcus sp. RDE2]